MARSTKPAEKPAAKKREPAKGTKPARQGKAPKATAPKAVVLRDLAEKLGREPKAVRASIRRLRGGAQVGQGGRYSWSSWEDKDLKALMKDLQPSK